MWQPLSMRIVETLQKHPEGLSSRHLAQKLVERQGSISAVLSRLYAYGAPLEKLNGNYGPRVIWRWKQPKKASLKIVVENEDPDERTLTAQSPTVTPGIRWRNG